MRITDKKYFSAYQSALTVDLEEALQQLQVDQNDIQIDFRVKTSAVSSSNIEGNSVDLNSFLNSEIAKESFKPKKEIDEINDLIEAYHFAINNPPTEENLLKAHRIFSKTLLINDKQGKYRTDRMGVYDNAGLVYLAVEPNKLNTETSIFFDDIQTLLQQDLSLEEVFYHASLIHLRFAQIHPFWDGNGRSARLLEKWFLASHLGKSAWKIESEHFYKENISAYYQNINLGMDFYSLNYDNCLPFIQMLVNSIQ